MTTSSKLIRALIKGYQVVVSPLLGRRCRYHPTCSAYVSDAVAAHGTAYGLWLGLKRIARCHPWADGGHDPVPAALPHSCSTSTKAE